MTLSLSIQRKKLASFPFARYEGADLGLEKGALREWLLTNGLGGYSSSTVCGLDTRKYHGLLVSADENLSRYVFLQKLEEEVRAGRERRCFSVNEYRDGSSSPGWKYLSGFDFNYDSVTYRYSSPEADCSKEICMFPQKNGIAVFYEVENKTDSPIEFRANLITNSRNIYDVTREGCVSFETRLLDSNLIGIKSARGYLTCFSDKAAFSQSPPDARWIRNVYYPKEADRGDTSTEDIYFPAYAALRIPARAKEEFYIAALAYDREEKTAEAFKDLMDGHQFRGRILSEGVGSNLSGLILNADSFLVKRGNKKTIIAGYHWFGEWGRDSMISLPGITFIGKRFDDAELVFENFLNRATPKGIPTRFKDGVPEYDDFDGPLWLIDRLRQYLKYVGPDRGKSLLKPYWWTLRDLVMNYLTMEKDGILMHRSGTWMDTLRRDSAVEIQGLWYNALRTMEDFARLLGEEIDVREARVRFEENFMKKYWNGSYLDDGLGDHSLRPNQVIALSMDYCVVPEEQAKKILDQVKEELLTPFGLRTLSPKDSRYRGAYTGGFSEREKAYHNGTVWPWLLGPYVRAYMRFHDRKSDVQPLLENLFEKHIREAGIGTISEVFDGDAPHVPRGCVSQAWSVAELLRTYFEDIMQKKPQYNV